MDRKQKELFGAWVQASGTTLAAIGSTPLKNFSESQLTSLNLWGNELQALGNALIADSEERFTLEKIGNQIQSAGNITVIAGIILPLDDVTGQELDIKGNLMQAVGGTAALKDTLTEERSVESLYNIYGGLLQIIGNSMHAIAGIIVLQGREGGNINTSGSWIQAAGSVIQAIGTTKDYSDEYG
ncbi:hypothetical protein LC048_01180 [Mesobacillus subterraneus]|uniref:DUF6944 family repetitive protein n=1 Tax=Mesobacillus subterraneus TaxID=285983 RepID=UPI00273F36D8|nr:hypothetical protein [Mesobacillus subterraneus]WLR55657.1 hypothetical protein LC048_01180 [Mesobacillus subterraneus]